MKRCHPIFLALLVGGPLLAPLHPAAAADAPLITDRGQTVTADEFRRAWQAVPAQERARLLAEAKGPDLLAPLLRRKLMAAEAERLGLDQEPSTRAKLSEARLNILGAALRDRVEAELSLPDFTPLARERYATRPQELATQGESPVAHLLVRVACEAEREAKLAAIQALKAQLDAGADFAALAAAHSEDASAAAGGQLQGWIPLDKLDPDFAAALASVPEGGISAPVKTPYGYHLIRRLGFRPAGIRPFAEVQAQLEQEVRAEYVRLALAEAQEAFNPGPAAVIDQAALEALLSELALTADQNQNPPPRP